MLCILILKKKNLHEFMDIYRFKDIVYSLGTDRILAIHQQIKHGTQNFLLDLLITNSREESLGNLQTRQSFMSLIRLW